MYYPKAFEEISYNIEHIQEIILEIENNFHFYFKKYLETENGNLLDKDRLQKLADSFGIEKVNKKNNTKYNEAFNRIIKDDISSFSSDRQKYLEILDSENTSEFDDDPSHFKNIILKNQCPIIHNTLQNRQAKELDKYRSDFQKADPGELLTVINKLIDFANNYKVNIYNSNLFDTITTIEELKFSELQDEKYFVFGVIGGGIKSHLLYKLLPQIFPNRSREAIWALWYLSSKKTFGCKEDSEFLMINTKDNTTQQNYFYPYDLFSLYSIKIYNLLKNEALKYSISLDQNYRFVIVDSFLKFVYKSHIAEIDLLKQKVSEDGYGHI